MRQTKPERGLQDGAVKREDNCRKPSPSDPEDQVFIRSDTKAMGAPRRSLQEGERHPRTPPPSASTRTGRVMNPGAPTPPSQPHSANHPHPCRPSDHGCPPAPEPRGQPTTNTSPTARAAVMHPDRPENHQRSRLCIICTATTSKTASKPAEQCRSQ